MSGLWSVLRITAATLLLGVLLPFTAMPATDEASASDDPDVLAYSGWQKVKARLVRERNRLGVNTAGSIAAAARELGISVPTLWRWLRIGDPPAQRRFELSSRHLYLIGDSKRVKIAWRRAVADEGLEVDYTTFYRAWMRQPPAVRRGVLKGVKAMRTMQVYGKYPDQQRTGTYQADHTKLPIWIWVPGFRHPLRPWLTVVIDVGTRSVVAWALTTRQPNAEVVIATLVDAILGWTEEDGMFVGGKPRCVRFDHGADFQADIVDAALRELGILADPADPYEPWQKPYIERLMGTAVHEFLAGLPGIGEVLDHRQRGPFRERPEALLTFEELWDHLSRLFEHYNRTRVHTTLKMPPLSKWAEDETPVERYAGNENELGVVLLRRDETRAVNQSGIRFRNVDYVDPALSAYRSERGRTVRVPIGWIESDPSFIWVYDPKTLRPVCRAVPPDDLSPEQVRGLRIVRRRETTTVRRIRLGATRIREQGRPARTGPEPAGPPADPRLRRTPTAAPAAIRVALGDPSDDPLFRRP